MTKLVETRIAYGEALLELGHLRPDVVVLDADLYKSTRTVLFKEAFPNRFFDMGISEADMVSTAAGMAATGLVPFCNSFAVFITSIGYLPTRVQIAYPRLPVKLVGSSAGLTQGSDGVSNQSIEDIGLMRVLPNMVVVSPADEIETRKATFAMTDWPGPVYFRLGRYPVPGIFDASYDFQIGKAVVLRKGTDAVIFATGHMVCKSLESAEILAKKGIDVEVVNISTIKPLDEATIRDSIKDKSLLVTVEEHNVIGGLGSAISECISLISDKAPLLRLGVQDCFGESASADELLEKHRLTGRLIAEDIASNMAILGKRG
jgi:transketolase